jgi:hypothetical protein
MKTNWSEERKGDDSVSLEKQKTEQVFLRCAQFCEFKKCCKKYKRGTRCKKCPKK